MFRRWMASILVAPAMLALSVAGAGQPPKNAAELGAAAFKSSGCFNCHTIGKIGTPLGPDLSHVGARYPAEYMARWLRDPALQRPNAHMPAFELSKAQVRALAAYLGSLD